MPRDLIQLVLPRPGAPLTTPSEDPISGPDEAAFVQTFGQLLPAAKYLKTATGKAAYYEMPPSSSEGNPHTHDRVLLIHGVQTPALGMLPLTKVLQTSFPQRHVVLVDLWGHGLSDTPVVPHDKALFHQLIDDLLDQLEWPTAHIVGYSFGGALTLGYVASRSSRVQSFTVVAPAGLIRSADFSEEERAYLRGDDEAAAQKWILRFLEGGELVVPTDWKERVKNGEVVAEALREWQMHEHPGHLASVIAVFRDSGVLDNDADFLGAVRSGIPSLAVLGELDDLTTQQELNGLGFANVFVVPQVGHGVVRERASEVGALITDFWTKIETHNR